MIPLATGEYHLQKIVGGIPENISVVKDKDEAFQAIANLNREVMTFTDLDIIVSEQNQNEVINTVKRGRPKKM